jgi:LysM repeat protein
LVDRLGLGAVDPLLLRLGVIVLIGVLLVPLAMSMRPASSNGSVQTEITAAPSTEPVASGEAPVVEDAPVVEVVAPSLGSGDEAAPVVTLSDETDEPAEPSAAPTEQSETSTSGADVTESAGDSGSAVAEAVQAPLAIAEAANEPADVAAADESAEVIAPACQLSYTVAAGDYWIRVADAAGISLAKLLQANLATVDTPLYPDDDICLPKGATLPSPPTTTAAPPATAPTTAAPTTAAPATTAPPTTTKATPSTTVAPTTAPPVATSLPTPGEVDDIIREEWPDELEGKALAIAWRESGYRANARNWCCYGLFQIHWSAHMSWLDDRGVTSPTQLLDARTNARVAYALYQRSGWGPWGG